MIKRVRPWALAAACASALVTPAARAVDLKCDVDRKTELHLCYAPSEVREKDGIRTAALYRGGPNRVAKTNFTMAVNCGSGVVHLKDRDGVSFAGGTTGTPAMRVLRDGICAVALKGKRS